MAKGAGILRLATRPGAVDNEAMSELPTQTLQIRVTPEFKQQLEYAAAKLNLSLSAYVMYLLHRGSMPAGESVMLERDVREVFGRHGELMRRLAK